MNQVKADLALVLEVESSESGNQELIDQVSSLPNHTVEVLDQKGEEEEEDINVIMNFSYLELMQEDSMDHLFRVPFESTEDTFLDPRNLAEIQKVGKKVIT